MSTDDWALAIVGAVLVVLALLTLMALAIRADYKVALSASIAKRNPPKPKAADQANVTDITGRAAS